MSEIIDNKKIFDELNTKPYVSKGRINEILAHAKELKGLRYDEVLSILHTEDPELVNEIFNTAKYVKTEIYGNRLVLFAPLYVSNLCNNECLYCAFRRSNKELKRKVLTQDEIRTETGKLLEQGHKRVLLVAGESYPKEGLNYIFKSIETVYSVKTDRANIRRINVNIAPLNVDEFKTLKTYNIGTYQLFQETYHEETYKKLHLAGPKKDYHYRLEAIDRAFEAGFQDVGIGILFGLYDWKYEVLALLSHIKHLESKFGIGPHTISLPRIEPASGSDLSSAPPYPVSDDDFKKIIAVLRLAVPYTGMILSTRETAEMRRAAFDLGISQISAGSKTNPGGYTHDDTEENCESQFFLGDTRPLKSVIEDMTDKGYVPSFCTGCYRLGRVGKDFMDLAKPGLIKKHCLSNAMFTFAEYLEDYVGNEEPLKTKGYNLIEKMLASDIESDTLKDKTLKFIEKIKKGERDIYL